jgi:hypothetical protein
MRSILIALLIASLATALSVKPDYFEIKDTGNPGLPKMDVGITINCDTNGLTVAAASNETGEAADNAMLYLFYTNYGYQVITSGKTGSDGTGSLDVHGNINYLTALFVLRVDKPGFQSREIEFTYSKCFENQTLPQNVTPPHNVSPPQNQPPPANVTPPLNATPLANATGQNQTAPETNQTGIPPAAAKACPVGLLLLALAYRAMK